MTDEGREPVSVITSLAHHRGNDVRVVLHLPGLDLAPGPVQLRCSVPGGRRVRRPAIATATGDGVLVEATFPVSRLRGDVWRLAVKAGDDAWVPVEARLLVNRRQPVALLPGPRPVTRLPEPQPLAAAPVRVPLAGRVRRRLAALRRR